MKNNFYSKNHNKYFKKNLKTIGLIYKNSELNSDNYLFTFYLETILFVMF